MAASPYGACGVWLEEPWLMAASPYGACGVWLMGRKSKVNGGFAVWLMDR